MSFADLERGTFKPTAPDDGFKASVNKLRLQVFKIRGNNDGINKLIDLLGSVKDTPDVRHKLTRLLEVTRDLVKQAATDLRGLNDKADQSRMQELAPVSKEAKDVIDEFQRVQKLSLEKQKVFVDRAKAKVSAADDADDLDGDLSPKGDEQLIALTPAKQQQQQQQISGPSEQEIAYTEQIIEEREHDIRDIETGIHELNEIFRDLGHIVGEQQSMLDNIERNVNSVAHDTGRASSELVTAHDYQRKAGRRMLCLLLTFILVLAIVLIAVLA